jgi:hypothetical protein
MRTEKLLSKLLSRRSPPPVFIILLLRCGEQKGQNPPVNSRNTIIAIIATLSASLAFAEDFKTINGKEYKNVTISRVEADGIVISTKGGISKVYFTELPKDVEERFHYNPAKAAPVQRGREQITLEAKQDAWRQANERRRLQDTRVAAADFDFSITNLVIAILVIVIPVVPMIAIVPVVLAQRRREQRALLLKQALACFRSGEIHVLDSSGKIERTIAFSEADRKL